MAERASLHRQLLHGVLALLAMTLLLLWFAGSWTIHQQFEGYLLTRLEHDADMLERQIERRDGRFVVHHQRINPIYRHPHSEHYYVVLAGRQRLSSPSLAGYELWTPVPPPANPYETLAPAGPDAPEEATERVLVYHRQVRIDGQPVHLFVAENHTPIQQALYRFDAGFALVAGLALLLSAGLVRWLMRRVFRQLAPVQRALASLDAGMPFEPPADLPQEIRPLVESLRQALERLQKQFLRARQHNANLAHALKTPLHVLFQRLDDPCLQQCPQLVTELRAQVERLHRLLERNLQRAVRAADVDAPRFGAQDLQDLLQAMRQLYPQIRIRCQDGVEQLPLEREDGHELLGNLLDNACKWADEDVLLRLRRAGRRVEILLEDDGPGVEESRLQQLAVRGYRLDEHTEGQGLGLAIVSDLLELYGGELHFSRGLMGGLLVRVSLPLGTPAGD